MMLWFLNIMDALVLMLIIAMKFDYHPTFRITFLGTIYLIGKAIIFRGSLMNWIDVGIAFFMLFMYFGIGLHGWLSIAVIIYLSYKLLASLAM